jgi:hypothetical protein
MLRVENLSRVTVKDMLRVFYAPIWDLARLCQASAVERDLDPTRALFDPNSIAPVDLEHTWSWCCTEPVILMKLWSELYNLRLAVSYERRQQLAPQELLDSCKYVYSILGTLAQLINSRMAKEYMDYLLFIDANTYYRGQILSKYESTSDTIRSLCEEGMYSQAVARYIKARIDEELNRPSEHARRAINQPSS